MKAALLKTPFDMEIQEIEFPEIKPNEVLIRVQCVGVCGSDLHTYKGTHPFRKPPVVLGHEMAGKVVEMGEKVTKFKGNERVTVEPQTYCMKCLPCFQGHYNLCKNKKFLGTTIWPGAFGEYITVPEDKVYTLPEELSFEEGVLVEPIAVGVHASQIARPRLGDTVLVMGSGTIGLATITALYASGARNIIATDKEDFNLIKAKEMGANMIININNEPLVPKVMDLTEGEGVDIAVLAVGVSSLIDESLNLVQKKGKIVLVANFDDVATIDTFKIVFGEVQIVGSFAYDKKDFETALALLSQGRINAKSFITHRWPLSKVKEALELLDKRNEDVVKIILNFKNENCACAG